MSLAYTFFPNTCATVTSNADKYMDTIDNAMWIYLLTYLFTSYLFIYLLTYLLIYLLIIHLLNYLLLTYLFTY